MTLLPQGTSAHVIRVADLGATFVFAIEGALAAVAAGLDPIGITTLAFLTALGGGIARDLLIGVKPAAMQDRSYTLIVLSAAAVIWACKPLWGAIPAPLLIGLDAAGLALAAVAGTEKAMDHGINRLTAIFLGAVGGVGGGTMRELVLNHVPSILKTDFYATAALIGGFIVVEARRFGISPRAAAICGGLACFLLRIAGVSLGWQLPHSLL